MGPTKLLLGNRLVALGLALLSAAGISAAALIAGAAQATEPRQTVSQTVTQPPAQVGAVDPGASSIATPARPIQTSEYRGIRAVPTKISTTNQVAPRIEQLAPDFTARDSKNQIVRLSDYRGKIVVLEWTNHECPYVRKHYGSGSMQALQAEAQNAGVVWLSIISSAPGAQGNVTGQQADGLTASRHAHPSAVLLDPAGELGRLYQAKATPHMFMIDPRGVLVYSGAIDDMPTPDPADLKDARNYVREGMRALLNGQKIAVSSTRAYGCSVKYGS